jgi:Recombinase.
LDNPQYTGCTVNGRSSIVSYKVHKKIEYDESEWQIIPNTQEAIIDEETFKTVHEMRASRRRNTATGRTSLFSNLVFCGDCGSKMYFCAAKSINENQEFFRCSAYKENRGTALFILSEMSFWKKWYWKRFARPQSIFQRTKPSFCICMRRITVIRCKGNAGYQASGGTGKETYQGT